MADSKAPAPPSSLASILEWSATRPEWQRDALRRIVCNGRLDADDLAELAVLCRTAHGLPSKSGKALIAIPLSNIHTPNSTDSMLSVSLVSLSELHNVGRIPSDQVLTFGTAPGLTIVYGENGAGKSGYARVLKKACRARGAAQSIIPDVFESRQEGPARGKITFCVEANEYSADWRDGEAPDSRLSNIFVFDSYSAQAHVADEGPASFKPRGLDVLPELARACDAISAELRTEINALNAMNSDSQKSWPCKDFTTTGKLIGGINASTNEQSIETAAVFTENDDKRLKEIGETLNANPKQKAADTSAASKRIRTFAEIAKSRATSVDDTAMQVLGDALRESLNAIEAARTASDLELNKDDLPGSGNDVWRQLWEAAREFSTMHAYPDRAFPVILDESRCVLCQQSLQPDAINRFQRFNSFVTDKSRQVAEASRAKVAALKPGLDALRLITTDVATIRADLDREAEGQYDWVEAFAKAIDARILHAQECLKEQKWVDAPAFHNFPIDDLIDLANRLDSRAKEEIAASNPENASALAAERDELSDKKWLAANKAEIKAQIARHREILQLTKCQEDCKTASITIKSGELHEIHVSTTYCKAFEDELHSLGMKTLPIKLESARGAKGERVFKIRLEGAPSANANDIASEGEHRCIAIAAFLAELSQASHDSALVFDDPVSSLDNARRIDVAKRLAQEAARRQVVIFTHDIIFLSELKAESELLSSDAHYVHLFWNGNSPGFSESGLPWDWAKYKERVDALEKEQRRLEKSWNAVPSPSNVSDMRSAYTHLSATMERVVEDVILNGVVGRHRDWIRVEKLDEVVGFASEEFSEISRIDKKCSGITSRHDPAGAKSARVPDPAEFLDDLNALKALIEKVKARRKAAKGATG